METTANAISKLIQSIDSEKREDLFRATAENLRSDSQFYTAAQLDILANLFK